MSVSRRKKWTITFICVTVLCVLSFIWIQKQLSNEKSFLYQLHRIFFPPKFSGQQFRNFQQDLVKGESYWVHNRLGREYFEAEDYDKSIEEYKKSIQIIESEPRDPGPLFKKNEKNGKFYQLSKEEMGKVNDESRTFKEEFPRHRLVEVYKKAGRYQEALEQIDWLLAHKPLDHVRVQLLAKREEISKKLSI